MATTIKVDKKKWNRIKGQFKRAASRHVEVGVLDPEEHHSGLQVATIAFLQEFGGFNIPERPFIMPIVNAFSKQLMERAAKEIVKGKTSIKAYQYVGRVLAIEIQDWIESNPYTLAAETIRLKKAAGAPFPEQALLEQGQLLESIKSKVSPNGNNI